MICSTRKTMMLAAAALLALGTFAGPIGCSQNSAPAPQATVSALPVDEAMQQRKWSTSEALYANGSVVAYSTRELIKFPLNTRYLRITGDTSAFLINTVWTPVTFLYDPFMAPVVYHGYQTPPSSTAVPPVEPDLLTTQPELLRPAPWVQSNQD
jgi:hypothetical protein